MLLKINKDNPDVRKISITIDCLKKGGIIIYPTDTLYAVGCDINNSKAIERLCRLKGLNPKKANLSFICKDLSNLSYYSTNLPTSLFKLMKRNSPGPFTFILNAKSTIPKLLKNNKKTIGIRIPDNNIAISIVEKLGNPIISTSLHIGDEILKYPTDPEEIYDQFGKQVDIVIDGGAGNLTPSTVVDFTTIEPEIIRQGAGELI